MLITNFHGERFSMNYEEENSGGYGVNFRNLEEVFIINFQKNIDFVRITES